MAPKYKERVLQRVTRMVRAGEHGTRRCLRSWDFSLEKRGLRRDVIATGRTLLKHLDTKPSSRAVLLVRDCFWGAGVLHRGLTPLLLGQDVTAGL